MFQDLSAKLDRVFKRLKNRGRLSEKDVREAMREVRIALLEADVHFQVARTFVRRATEKAVGREVLRSVTPGQQVIKVVYEELIRVLGERTEPLRLTSSPAVVLLVGLQGSGKTTQAAKLAVHLRKAGRKPLLVAADVRRPAAVEQLEVLGRGAEIPVHALAGERDVLEIARSGLERARKEGRDLVLLDTAGRLHVDAKMMDELVELAEAVSPDEILLVVDAMTGQEAVRVSEAFVGRLAVTGLLLTKLDGDARGGAALSMHEVTGLPIKFVGTGEKAGDLEAFHPDRMASRILGMGDVVTLVERAQEAVDHEAALALQKKLRERSFTLEDFEVQLRQVRKMGPISQVLGMIPGVGGKALETLNPDDGELVRVEAIIRSMTVQERRHPGIIDGSRRKRIAAGSGTSLQDVNRLLKQFEELKRMMKRMSRTGLPKGFPMGHRS